MKREELEAMTKVELAEHAEVQGVKLGSLDSKGTMIDKILGEYKEPSTEKRSKSGMKMQKDMPDIPLGALYTLDGKKVEAPLYRVVIFSTESDKSDVPLVVNGYNIIIKRGHEVLIMEPYVDILRNAVIDTVVQDPDTGARTQQRMMVYPHQAVPV